MQRVRLNYEEDEIHIEAVQAWQLMLTRPSARIDSNILHSGIKQGKYYCPNICSFIKSKKTTVISLKSSMYHT